MRLLPLALDDRLHQPYRMGLIRDLEAVRTLARECGCAASCISGAGPTCLCITDGGAEALTRRLPQEFPGWRALCLQADREGTKIIGEETL